MFLLKCFPFAFVCVLFLAATSQAEDPLSDAATATEPIELNEVTEPNEIKIFMRMSEKFFDELTQDIVKMSEPVQECVEGMPVRGQAFGEGRTSVQLDFSREKAQFVVTLTGSAVASLLADVGPANASLTSHAQFTVHKKFEFDGAKFTSNPAESTSRNQTTIDQICAKKRGLVGRLIERIGRRLANKATPEVNAMAEDFSEVMISESFDEISAELLAELNQTTKFEETVMKYFPEAIPWEYRLATRPNFLVAGVGPPGATFPEFLNAENETFEAMMEMWLPLTPGQAALLEVVGDFGVTHDLLCEFLSEDEANEMAEDVKLVRRGEWSVIQIGLPKTDASESPQRSTSQ